MAEKDVVKENIITTVVPRLEGLKVNKAIADDIYAWLLLWKLHEGEFRAKQEWNAQS